MSKIEGVFTEAVFSVSDKTGIDEFAAGISSIWDIYATTGTAAAISSIDVAGDFNDLISQHSVYGKIASALTREEQAGVVANMILAPSSSNEPCIKVVCVNLSPGPESSNRDDVGEAFVDFGGLSLLQAAVKRRLLVISNPRQYGPILDWFDSGMPDAPVFMDKLSSKAEREIASYTGGLATRFAQMSKRTQ